MKKNLLLLTLLLLNVIAFSFEAKKQHNPNYYFIENKGQVVNQQNQPNNDVVYLFSKQGFRVQLKHNAFSYELVKIKTTPKQNETNELRMPHEPEMQDVVFYSHRVDVTLIGSNPNPAIKPFDVAEGQLNYYTVNTPETGITQVKHYKRVVYQNIYPNIDLEFIVSGKTKQFKYNFIIRPGGNINQIKLQYSGADKTTLTENGQVLIETPFGNIEEQIPHSYEVLANNKTKTIKANFVNTDAKNTFGISAETFDASKTLVIDPLPWSSFFGGSLAETVYGINIDSANNLYLTGTTVSTANIATTGAFQTTYGGGTFDAYISKFSSSGSIIWSSYFGGTLGDYGFSIAFDSIGTMILGGFTLSTTGIATANSHQPALAGLQDGFVMRLNDNGTRIWGTYYGGSAGNEALYGIATFNGDVYATGYTNSQTGTSIATTGSFQATYGTGAYDAFLVRFNGAGIRQWGTYYGGTGDDRAIGLSIDKLGDIIICGQTASATAMSTAGAHQPTFAGSISGYIAKFSSAGNRVWSTYYGGTQNTVTVSNVVDANGTIVVGGYTGSTSGIASPGAHQTTLGGGPVSGAPYDGFLCRFSSTGTRLWGTYYGGSDYDIGGFGLAVDTKGNVLFPGTTASTNAIASVGAFKTTNSGGSPIIAGSSPNGFDAFMLKMDSNGVRQWCTYYGNTGMDYVRTVITDSKGYSYWGGYGNSTTGIATTGAYQTANNGSDDVFIVALNTKGNFDPDAANNASVSALVGPKQFCAGNHDIKVKVKNNGINPITTVQVNWEFDGIIQTPLVWNTLLDTVGGSGANEATVTLATNVPFTQNVGKTLRAWTSLPNNTLDTVPSDDSISVYLKPALNGTYLIDGITGNYTNFASAISDLNTFGHCGSLQFNVTAGASFTEPPLVLTRSGNATDSMVFQKFGFGPNPIIYGNNGVGATDAVIHLLGVSNITFDGIDVADSTGNITATTQMEFGFRVTNASSTIGAQKNVIKNCAVTLNRTNIATVGISQITTTAATTSSGGNHNNLYENIRVGNSYGGIVLQGTAAFPDSNNVITSSGTDTTCIGTLNANDIGNGTAIVNGIVALDQRNVEISKTIVRNLTHTGTLISGGIWLNNSSTVTNFGTARIFNNIIYNLSRTSTSTTGSISGIKIDVSTTATANVYNNIIHSITTANPTTAAANTALVRGISHYTLTAVGTAQYYNNSIHLNVPGANASSAAFCKAGTSLITCKNNIFSNASPAQTGVGKHYAMAILGGGITDASNNILWAPNSNGFVALVSSVDCATLQRYAAGASAIAPTDGVERGSANADPNFVSATDLSFIMATPASQSGVRIFTPNIDTDIFGNVRSATTPTIGAIETVQAMIDSAAPVISNVIIGSGVIPTIYATVADNSNNTLGNIKLWYRAGTTGAFTDVSPDSVPTSGNGTYKWSSSLSSLSIGTYQFYICARDLTNQGQNIAVNPIQNISFTGFSSTDPVNLVANPDAGANTRTFTKTSALAGGTYTVGTTGTYTKLSDVANLLNTSSITGDVVFELLSTYDGTTGETLPINFNQYFTSGGNWNVTIRPASGVTSRITSGDPGSGQPLIVLNGIDKITFDGRPGGTGQNVEWTIRNTRAATTFSSAIRFINGATFDTLQYLRVESQNTLTTSGTIELLTTNIAQGNSKNTIRFNEIRNRSDVIGTPAIGIYSAGTATNVNDSNAIVGNKIFNWSAIGVHVTGTGNGSGWNINGNSFYSTSAITTAQTNIRFEAGLNSIRNTIANNYIGGTAPLAASGALTNSVTGVWRGIVCSSGISDSSYITNNIIQNIMLTGGTGTFAGIECTGGLNSIADNTIGSSITANSIQTSQLGTVIGIWLNNANNVAIIHNNTIANVTSTGNSTAVGHNGIRITTANTTAPLVIKNNTLFNLSADNPTVSTSTPSMAGIVSIYAGLQQTISHNTIYNITTAQTANAAGSSIGINVSNASGAGNIFANNIYGIKNSTINAGAQAVGIHIDLGSAWNVYNNMISLGYNMDSAAVLNGIVDKSAGNNNNIFYNSVLISGNAASLAATGSHCYKRNTTANTNIRNNIFSNIRTGNGAHYAINNAAASPNIGWQSNYNVLNSSNVSQLGIWNGTASNFNTWKITSSYDTASVNYAPNFVSNTDLHISGASVGNLLLSGTPLLGFLVDFDGQIRHANVPYIGADEAIISLPITLTSFTAIKTNATDVKLNWGTAQEINSSNFVVERSVDGKQFETIGSVKSAVKSNMFKQYTFIDVDAFSNKNNTLYYRLKMVDLDGSFEYSKLAQVNFDSGIDNKSVTVYPNPFNTSAKLIINTNEFTTLNIQLRDMQGRAIWQKNILANMGNSEFDMQNLTHIKAGIYYLHITDNIGYSQTIKIVKY